ncbi:MarC family protein [uncultured Desulfovibrio sp.]|uniref:MarC family protein n=1 Tax=uncultured Desulfovibrio sp. TaxID=167968 RepID=UPI002803AF03|nr:MarC family protein [uncultured Desulfovibrio sp.]
MEELTVGKIVGLAIKLYALMTPPAVLSAFISHMRGHSKREKYLVACKASIAIFILGEVLFIFGSHLFALFGFTLDAFRIGVGLLLFLTAISLMNEDETAPPVRRGADISVVPLAIPLGMGPSAIGTVMVLGAQSTGTQDLLVGTFCLLLASIWMAALLCLADPVQRLIGRTGIAVLAKLTALLLSAIAAQVIFTGIRGFLHQ